jgi:pimeloyl-ACP methyl ester carboxylesterase
MQKLIIVSVIAATIVLFLIFGLSSIERRLLYYPTHRPADNSLEPWVSNGRLIGYSREVRSPKNVWLMLHGNGGQASDRIYSIPRFSDADSVFILEYPGYGKREGVPSKAAFNQAAKEAYLILMKTYSKIPVCVVAESIGSGPAAFIAGLTPAPDKLVLIVPFDKLTLVAENYFPVFLVALILKDNWDNVEALSNYTGPIDIFGAEADTIIPVGHARALAAAVRQSRFVLIDGGHNDWALQGRVRIMNP